MTFAIFLLLMLLSVPIGITLILSSVFYIWHSDNTVLFASFSQQLFGSVENYGLMAIPLFILAGELMNAGGLTKRLINFARLFFGGLRGGLAYINLLANMLMAAILGSAVAQIAVMSQSIVPEMEKEGYDKSFATALTAISGLMGSIIPPSMMFVIYGVLAQISIGDMFTAGIIPGLLMGLGILVVIFLLGIRHQYPKGQWPTKSAIWPACTKALPALSIPVIIIGGILSGWTTPTESAAVASIVSLFVGLYVYKELRWVELPLLLERTALNTGMVLFLVAAAGVFGWTITFEQVPQMVATWVGQSTSDPFMFMLMVCGLLLLIGTVLDGIAALILVVPILLPIAVGEFGINPFQFGVVICLVLVLGLLTPPVGTGLFVASAMTGVPSGRLFKVLLPFLLVTGAVVVLLSYFPWLSMALL
ncbi:TRAP transporter large permease [Paenalcaligenes sp. Me131]|uniref:TRAP transporter large permease n=1 Tax=Paenalcaligenes sp. Me131 TaxID=3392636 RepID=UPI003D2882A7